jgi:aminoglycoside phosphotransferase (APT) family kinase protein
VTVAQHGRDLEAVRAGLERWLRARHPDADDVRVAPLARPSSGYSSETLFVDSVRTEGTREVEARFVARLPPAGGGIFPTYDLRRQAEVQSALARVGIPVARPIAVETDEEWIGAPFFLMARVDGTILDEGYVASGPLHDAAPSVQRRVHTDFLDLLAAVHTVDWRALGLGALTPEDERGLVHDLERADAYLMWAGDGDASPVLTDALAWLHARRPEPEPPLSLCWGDPRLGNVVYGPDFTVRAALDWETASIGPAELDLAWFIGLHEVTTGAFGHDLAGFLAHDDALDHWADRIGRAVVDYRWFEVMSLLRAESVFLRIRRMLLASGMDAPWLRGATPSELRIATLIR